MCPCVPSLPRRRSWGFITRSCPTFVGGGLRDEPKEGLHGRLVRSRSDWNLEVLVSQERGKTKYREKKPHWWEASALTTAPPLLPYPHTCFIQGVRLGSFTSQEGLDWEMPQCSNSVDNQTVDAICFMLNIARITIRPRFPKGRLALIQD